MNVDIYCPIAKNAKIYKKFGCFLIRDGFDDGNDTYYIMQLLETDEPGYGPFYVFCRYGAVGKKNTFIIEEKRLNKDGAINFFKDKFKRKTKITWEQYIDDENKGDGKGKGWVHRVGTHADYASILN